VVHWIVDTAIAEYGKGRTNLRNHLDHLVTLKARRQGKREDTKQLDGSAQSMLMKGGVRYAD
jgi:hypothetical protein